MKAAFKLLLGILLTAVGVIILLPGFGSLWKELVIILKGSIPLILIFFGLIIIWIEAEELKGPPKPPKKK